jgi:hypothetical protein
MKIVTYNTVEISGNTPVNSGDRDSRNIRILTRGIRHTRVKVKVGPVLN